MDISNVKNRALSPATLSKQYGVERMVVGVAIIVEEPTSRIKKMLLVQRSAEEKMLPNMFELPGGKAEHEDTTILDTVARETLEETGFVVTRIVEEFSHFDYTTSRGLYRQLNFVVEVEGSASQSGGLPIPTLNPEEHQAYRWVAVKDSDSLGSLPMTPGMKEGCSKRSEGYWLLDGCLGWLFGKCVLQIKTEY
ncbi:NUDIX-domain-containing protein [Mycena venus]|uniref:NUDIX-domain-containing protein n=1 Tax=Mycena venus TaxID=2733690 RepID=A0A8H6XXR8_9AGAR|nr:NUDIX-domain-containing protein [Mycena venus]